MRYLFFTINLLLFATVTFSQATIRGTIFNGESEVLPGAYIYLDGTDFSGVSDLNGAFQISGIPAGNYQILISYLGYEDQKIEATIVDKTTLNKDITLTEGLTLNEVVINGRLEGFAKALNTQKNRLNITNIIAGEQIERFPDANIGDALKRVSGINVQYDQGEARFANIRGTAPELNSITINGERIPSAEAEQRYVQLDLIPADVIETIELNKAVTPDMDGDAIGGSINLVTEKATGERKIEGTIGTGYLALRGKPLYKGKISYSERYMNNKIGLILNASILDKFVRSDNIEAEWDYSDENNKDGSVAPTDFQIRQYFLERLRQSYSATLDFAFNKNHGIWFNGMYNWRNDWENRYRLRFKDIEEDNGQVVTEIRRQTKGGVKDNKYGRLEDQRMQSFGAGGEHFFNNVKLNWSLSSLKASEDRPNERYVSMNAKDVVIDVNLKDPETPFINPTDAQFDDLSDGYGLKEITEEFQFTEEEDLNGRVDLELPILFGKHASYLKFGGRYKNKKKVRDNSFKEYEPTNEDAFVTNALANTSVITEDNFTPGDYEIGSFVSKEFLGKINFEDGFEGEEVLEEFAGNFESEESVLGGYLMYTQNFGDELSLIGGVRYEQTEVNSKGKIFDEETLSDTEEHEADYSNFLPGLHLKYSPNKRTNLRFAWTNTLARPNYYDLVPFQEINTEDNEIKVGNAELEATTSMNFDLLAEHYFKSLGIISGGFFYKDLTNVIANKVRNDFAFGGNTYDVFEQSVNAGDADLYGFEIGLQRRLDFLPSVLSNLSLYANYTYTESELKNITLEDREDEVLPLVGTPENLFNVSLAFDTKKLDVRVSYNFADAFIEEYNDEAFYDRWYDAVSYLDLNADYQLTDNWKLYLSVNNLLDQPLRYYQGVEDRTMQIEYYGIQGRLGVKFQY